MTTQVALVTGGAGFIGSHIVDRLVHEGYEVIVLDNESTGFRANVSPGAHFIHGDVTCQNDVETVFQRGIDVVFHIAGQASTILSFDNPTTDLITNTIGTLNILNACLKHHVPRLLYASSMTIYGHPQRIPVQEDELPKPISYYGISKYAAERYVLVSSGRHDLGFDFNATAFRMFNVYGPRQRLDNPYQGVMGIFIGNVLRNEVIQVFGDGKQSRDFVYIDDVVNIWMSAIKKPASFGKAINVGFGQAVSINQLIKEVVRAHGLDPASYPVQYGPPRPGDQRHMQADISLAQEVLGWLPGVDLTTGLQKTLAWALQNA